MSDIPRPLLEEFPELDEWAILTAWRGSIAHGMYVEKAVGPLWVHWLKLRDEKGGAK